MKSIFSKSSITGIIALGILSLTSVAQVKAATTLTSQQAKTELARFHLKSDISTSLQIDEPSDTTMAWIDRDPVLCTLYPFVCKTSYWSGSRYEIANNSAMTELTHSSPDLEMKTSNQIGIWANKPVTIVAGSASKTLGLPIHES